MARIKNLTYEIPTIPTYSENIDSESVPVNVNLTIEVTAYSIAEAHLISKLLIENDFITLNNLVKASKDFQKSVSTLGNGSVEEATLEDLMDF